LDKCLNPLLTYAINMDEKRLTKKQQIVEEIMKDDDLNHTRA
jgi:hypothetical protein